MCVCVCVCVFCFITTQVEQDILIYSNDQEGEESGQDSVCASVCMCVWLYLCMVTLTSVPSL